MDGHMEGDTMMPDGMDDMGDMDAATGADAGGDATDDDAANNMDAATGADAGGDATDDDAANGDAAQIAVYYNVY